MSYKKPKKVELETVNLVEEVREGVSEESMTFDVYFQILLKERKVLAHHKPPMRQYAVTNEMSSATRTEFDELFKSY
jgi:hypothetical protein